LTRKSQNRPKINILSSEGTPDLRVAVRSFLPMVMDELNENNKSKSGVGRCDAKDSTETRTPE